MKGIIIFILQFLPFDMSPKKKKIYLFIMLLKFINHTRYNINLWKLCGKICNILNIFLIKFNIFIFQ